jgi:hypothetical protein
LLFQVVWGEVELMRRLMPESNETYSAEQWKRIVEALKPRVDKSAKPLHQRN